MPRAACERAVSIAATSESMSPTIVGDDHVELLRRRTSCMPRRRRDVLERQVGIFALVTAETTSCQSTPDFMTFSACHRGHPCGGGSWPDRSDAGDSARSIGVVRPGYRLPRSGVADVDDLLRLAEIDAAVSSRTIRCRSPRPARASGRASASADRRSRAGDWRRLEYLAEPQEPASRRLTSDV